MTDRSIFPIIPASDLTLASLGDLRHKLLRLHKALVDSERISYERFHGRAISSGELLQLVTGGEVVCLASSRLRTRSSNR